MTRIVDGLNRLSKEHQNNPLIGYLNINSLPNKIPALCIDETKFDESFPDAQFHIQGYQ